MVTTLHDTQITFELLNVAPIPTCGVVVKVIILRLFLYKLSNSCSVNGLCQAYVI